MDGKTISNLTLGKYTVTPRANFHVVTARRRYQFVFQKPPCRTSVNPAKILRMKDNLLTLEELEETWWWRREENRKELERMKLFGYLLAARNYELMRRAPGGGEFNKKYLELNRVEKTTAAIAWINRDEIPYRQTFDLKRPVDGWTTYPPLQWNLRLSERILKRAFWDYINQQRNAQKIALSHPLKGKRNRPPTWDYVECLDKKRNKMGNMNDVERGMASKAEQLAIRCLDEFKQAQVKYDEIATKSDFYNEFDDFSEEPDL